MKVACSWMFGLLVWMRFRCRHQRVWQPFYPRGLRLWTGARVRTCRAFCRETSCVVAACSSSPDGNACRGAARSPERHSRGCSSRFCCVQDPGHAGSGRPAPPPHSRPSPAARLRSVLEPRGTFGIIAGHRPASRAAPARVIPSSAFATASACGAALGSLAAGPCPQIRRR